MNKMTRDHIESHVRWYLEFLTLEKAPMSLVDTSIELGKLFGIPVSDDNAELNYKIYEKAYDLLLAIGYEFYPKPISDDTDKITSHRSVLLRNFSKDIDIDVQFGGKVLRPYKVINPRAKKTLGKNGYIISVMYEYLFRTTEYHNLLAMVGKCWNKVRVESPSKSKAMVAMGYWESMQNGKYKTIPERYEELCVRTYKADKGVTRERYFELLDTIYRPLTNPGGFSKNIISTMEEMMYIKSKLLD